MVNQKKPGYIVAIIVNVIMIFVFNNLLNWGVPFITSAFADVLWAINLSLNLTIAANVTYLFYDATWYRHLSQAFLNIIAIVMIYTVYNVFPFDESNTMAVQALRIALPFLVVALGIAFIVEVVKLLQGKE